jgi:hypothetical protein
MIQGEDNLSVGVVGLALDDEQVVVTDVLFDHRVYSHRVGDLLLRVTTQPNVGVQRRPAGGR